jgi:hypothetical protein
MTENHEFLSLMERVRAGSKEAAAELYTRYSSHLHSNILKGLTADLRKLVGAAVIEQIEQEVWRELLFEHPSAIRPFRSPDEFLSFLMSMASKEVEKVAIRLPRQPGQNAPALEIGGAAISAMSESPELEIYIDPGDAPKEVIQEVLECLSDLHRAAGGLGLEFRIEGNQVVAVKEVER